MGILHPEQTMVRLTEFPGGINVVTCISIINSSLYRTTILHGVYSVWSSTNDVVLGQYWQIHGKDAEDHILKAGV